MVIGRKGGPRTRQSTVIMSNERFCRAKIGNWSSLHTSTAFLVITEYREWFSTPSSILCILLTFEKRKNRGAELTWGVSLSTCVGVRKI